MKTPPKKKNEHKVVLASITQNLVLKCSFCNLQDRAQVKSSQEPKMNRSRGWCFTLNNYSVEEEETIRNAPCAYMLFGRERGDEGTPHLQGYVHFKNEKSLKQLKALMPRAHVEARKGTINRP